MEDKVEQRASRSLVRVTGYFRAATTRCSFYVALLTIFLLSSVSIFSFFSSLLCNDGRSGLRCSRKDIVSRRRRCWCSACWRRVTGKCTRNPSSTAGFRWTNRSNQWWPTGGTGFGTPDHSCKIRTISRTFLWRLARSTLSSKVRISWASIASWVGLKSCCSACPLPSERSREWIVDGPTPCGHLVLSRIPPCVLTHGTVDTIVHTAVRNPLALGAVVRERSCPRSASGD